MARERAVPAAGVPQAAEELARLRRVRAAALGARRGDRSRLRRQRHVHAHGRHACTGQPQLPVRGHAGPGGRRLLLRELRRVRHDDDRQPAAAPAALARARHGARRPHGRPALADARLHGARRAGARIEGDGVGLRVQPAVRRGRAVHALRRTAQRARHASAPRVRAAVHRRQRRDRAASAQAVLRRRLAVGARLR